MTVHASPSGWRMKRARSSCDLHRSCSNICSGEWHTLRTVSTSQGGASLATCGVVLRFASRLLDAQFLKRNGCPQARDAKKSALRSLFCAYLRTGAYSLVRCQYNVRRNEELVRVLQLMAMVRIVFSIEHFCRYQFHCELGCHLFG